jgi:hypothetical protein
MVVTRKMGLKYLFHTDPRSLIGADITPKTLRDRPREAVILGKSPLNQGQGRRT